MNTTFKLVKGRTGTRSCPLDSKSYNVNASCETALTAKQADYVYNKCKNEEIIGSEQVYECKKE